ncbi:unnamed protein product [Rhizophagus irregularis]|nr:unnamed protein product [Rhizophagus irregularis]
MENTQFSELYETFTSGQFNNQGVRVYVHQNKTDKMGRKSMKDINPPSFPDAFDIMIRNTQQLKLSQHCTEHTRRDLLYNEIIDLLCNYKVNWKGGIHQTLGKEFVTHVANALWYIDPYLKLLQSRSCHMPAFFKELATYASDNTDRNTYNLAYYTSHHKKEPTSHQKLNLLIESLELSIGQSWVNNSKWNNTISAIISLIEIM